jgi:hypothetical protein
MAERALHSKADRHSHEEDEMGVYMVDRSVPGLDGEALEGAQRAAIETTERFRGEGKAVRYIRSTFVPSEDHLMCLFEAQSADLVREVNEAAGLPFSRIMEAQDLTP